MEKENEDENKYIQKNSTGTTMCICCKCLERFFRAFITKWTNNKAICPYCNHDVIVKHE